MNAYYYLIFATLSNAFANLLLKQSSVEKLSGIAQYLSFKFISAIALFAISLLFYKIALRSIPINIGYPILIGIGSIIIFSFSMVFFKEVFIARQLLGVILIICGVLLIGM
jgi:multidrug transporter EmrE-like cation transporter